jgi:hypothetical protein
MLRTIVSMGIRMPKPVQCRTFTALTRGNARFTPQTLYRLRGYAKVNDSLDDAETSIQAKANIIDLDEEARTDMSQVHVGGWRPTWLTVPERFSTESSFDNLKLVLSRLREAAKAFEGMQNQGAFVDLTAPDQDDGMVHIIVPEDVYKKYWESQPTEQTSSGVDTNGGHQIPSRLLKEIQRVHDEEPSPETFKERLESFKHQQSKNQKGAMIGWELRADAESLFCNLKLPDLISRLKQVADWIEETSQQGPIDVFFENGQIVVICHDAKLAEIMCIPPLYAK